MKRFTLFLLGLFLCLGNTKAQSLIGTWKSITESKGQEIEVFFTFAESTFNMRNVFSINEPSLGIITFSISIPGDYTLLDDKLNIKAKSNKIEFKVEDMKFVGEVADKIRKKPELKERIRKILEKKTKKSKNKFTSGFPENGNIPIISFTDDQLVLDLGRSEVMTFTRVN